MIRHFAALALSAGLCSCAVGPDFQAPVLPAAAGGPFVERPINGLTSDEPALQHWWHLFEDPLLDKLVGRALKRNTDLRIASAALNRARAVLAATRNRALPTTEASAQFSSERVSIPNGVVNNAGQAGNFDFYRLGFDAAYEIDLFGGVSRSIEAARGDARAAEFALAATRVAVAAETARTYALACGFAEQAEEVRQSAALQRQTLALTERLVEAGRGTQRDVARAAALAEALAAQVPELEAERRAALYALSTLTGDTPAETDQAASACLSPPSVATTIPVGDGAALLRRRPDVAEGEARLAADTARIGVAVAELYPSIRLLGSVGLGATSPSRLTDSASTSFSIGPLISWSIPNLGAARARIAQAEAQEQESLAVFDSLILRALQETEQALARYAGAAQRRERLRRAEVASAEAARLTEARFRAGADNFLDLLDAQRSLADARLSLAQANTAVAEAQVSLFKALGGGWELPED